MPSFPATAGVVLDSLILELSLTRLEAKYLADVLPACKERRDLRDTILACDIMLTALQSGTVTQERVREMRQSYEGWKRSKHEQYQRIGYESNLDVPSTESSSPSPNQDS